MSVPTRTFQNLQTGVKAVDDKRVMVPVNQALQYLSGTLQADIDAAIAAGITAFSNSNSVQISAAISVYASARPAFKAHKNGTDQDSISGTATPITFGTEVFDVGGYYASNAWTPPAGKYRVSACVLFNNNNALDNELLDLRVRVGGVLVNRTVEPRTGTGQQTVHITTLLELSGSQAVAITAQKSGAGVGLIEGDASDTWFCGEAIS